MEAYLDNSATTRCLDEVAEVVNHAMVTEFGNPSAMHKMGVEAEKLTRRAANQLADSMKVQEKEIYFTSGGTESNNIAILGCAAANKRRGMHLITTAFEHPSVSGPMTYLEEQGFQVTRLIPDQNGIVSAEAVASAVTPETILVSIMQVNNEAGFVQPIAEIGSAIKQKNPDTYFHVDAVQSFGKYVLRPKSYQVDMLSVSGHKIHGPKGIGCLYVREGVKINPIQFGGGQQKNLRSGTENVPGIAGLGIAAELSYVDLAGKTAHLNSLKTMMTEGLKNIEDIKINSSEKEGTPHILNVSFLGVRSEVLLHTLEERGICISAGSACSSHKRGMSPTLKAIGATKEQAECAVRFSFSSCTKREEIRYCLDILSEVLPVLRRYRRH